MNDETQQTDARRLEKEEIEDLGTVTLARGEHVIHCLTVIGQIEGHSEAPQGQKTTKYEHVIPQLVAAQEDPRIEGLLVLLNTVGGDVEAGLALAELPMPSLWEAAWAPPSTSPLWLSLVPAAGLTAVQKGQTQ